MIKDENVNIKITLSKKQTKWLEKQCIKCKCSKSKYIAWILSRKASEILEQMYLKKGYSLEEIYEIAKTDWIK